MYKERWEHDLQISYDIELRYQVYGGVTNLFDQQPDIAAGFGYPVSAVGRSMYVGFRVKLDRLL